MPAARGHARYAGSFRMKDRGADADRRRSDDNAEKVMRRGEQQQAAEGKAHADCQRIGLGLSVGIDADERLQQRGGQLEGQGDQADLTEVEAEFFLEDRIDGREERLNRVIQKVREAQCEKQSEDRGFGRCGWSRRRVDFGVHRELFDCQGLKRSRVARRRATPPLAIDRDRGESARVDAMAETRR